MKPTTTEARSILTRASGYLEGVASHSLQPYQGCPFGTALCGVGCYVRHAGHLTKGRPWGSFLEAKTNAADLYRATVDRERRWAGRNHGAFGIFLSSATEPFPPQEARLGVTAAVLDAIREHPPDLLIVQTHSHQVARHRDRLRSIAERARLRVHVSIETDRDRLPGLPGHASSIDRRFAAAQRLRDAGLFVVITVAPLLPIAEPDRFFARIAESADAVVLDHFIEGDGTPNGSRTELTPLPEAMRAVEPASVALAYRDAMAAVAAEYLPGRVGLGREGFAGRWNAQPLRSKRLKAERSAGFEASKKRNLDCSQPPENGYDRIKE